MDLSTPVTLENAHVRLEPLATQHAEELAEAAAGLEYAWYTVVPRPEEMADEIAKRLGQRDAGTMNPWAIRSQRTGRTVGMTTFCGIDQPNRHVEVGYTWLARDAQGTEVNPAAKLLVLGHAFETCDAIAVELRTHWHNHQSRAAIARLGAKQDGVLRSHRLGPDGTLRDTVVFSIIAAEWPTVRTGLAERLRRY
jgi:N-acetyltransferase